jgi:hypothetical protein
MAQKLWESTQNQLNAGRKCVILYNKNTTSAPLS